MEARDEATRAGMVDDIDEMDRIIGQFLDFARTNEDAARRARRRQRDRSGPAVERHVRSGHDVRFAPGAACRRAAAIDRFLAARRESSRQRDRLRCAAGRSVTRMPRIARIVLEIADRGAGIAPDQVERLKQPFTRASVARSNEGNVAGAGLGLRDRRAHRAPARRDVRLCFPRDGGGTLAQRRDPGARVGAYGAAVSPAAREARCASAAMPSPRPVNPRRSVVVAFTLTSSSLQPRSAARFARIAGNVRRKLRRLRDQRRVEGCRSANPRPTASDTT